MTKKAMPLADGQIDVLILQALVRKLVAKSVLSPDDVRASLFDAVSGGERGSLERLSGTQSAESTSANGSVNWNLVPCIPFGEAQSLPR